jgi:hypothetical protein
MEAILNASSQVSHGAPSIGEVATADEILPMAIHHGLMPGPDTKTNYVLASDFDDVGCNFVALAG